MDFIQPRLRNDDIGYDNVLKKIKQEAETESFVSFVPRIKMTVHDTEEEDTQINYTVRHNNNASCNFKRKMNHQLPHSSDLFRPPVKKESQRIMNINTRHFEPTGNYQNADENLDGVSTVVLSHSRKVDVNNHHLSRKPYKADNNADKESTVLLGHSRKMDIGNYLFSRNAYKTNDNADKESTVLLAHSRKMDLFSKNSQKADDNLGEKSTVVLPHRAKNIDVGNNLLSDIMDDLNEIGDIYNDSNEDNVMSGLRTSNPYPMRECFVLVENIINQFSYNVRGSKVVAQFSMDTKKDRQEKEYKGLKRNLDSSGSLKRDFIKETKSSRKNREKNIFPEYKRLRKRREERQKRKYNYILD